MLTNVLVYHVMGKLVAEYNSTVVMGGRQYLFNDQQGTPRTITNNQGAIIARRDYLPFGEDMPNNVGMRTSTQGYGGVEAARQKYAGMEKDDATGMAHTLWRKYDSFSARWTSPDPYAGSMTPAEPQSFNRYTYVNNDPVNHVDPTGLALADIGVYQTTNTSVVTIVHRIQTNAIRNFVTQRCGGLGVSVAGGFLGATALPGPGGVGGASAAAAEEPQNFGPITPDQLALTNKLIASRYGTCRNKVFGDKDVLGSRHVPGRDAARLSLAAGMNNSEVATRVAGIFSQESDFSLNPDEMGK